jgi:hypothetical protein
VTEERKRIRRAATVWFLSLGVLASCVVFAGARVARAESPGDESRSEAEPLRRGTILGGWFPFAVFLAPGGTPECEWNAECIAWLAARCNAALAGRDPGVHSSIVDVRDLAGSRKKRTLSVYPKAPGIVWGGLGVEFWSRDCREIEPDTWIPVGFTSTARFKIPRAAVWMTVATVDDTSLSWALS